ncbi:MAG: hypothetical protein ACD_41C00306G0012 [uncultured bacterium]|nr:MAG: hypothetical protein ACD_41C00306G0012 [uncultured bacterium]HBY74255.1 hypothetical protein [Candidatus Kerfeldbacteria bacterium]
MDQSRSEKLKDIWWSIRSNRIVRPLALVAGGLVVVLIGLYIVLSYYGKLPWSTARVTVPDDLITNSTIPAAIDLNQQVPRALDGVPVLLVDSDRFPLAVMIENLVTIRPQAGLSAAGIVYEALAEGGITRFLAIYTTAEAIPTIGPIRSARTYYVDWAEEYGGVFAYVGGSPEALGLTGSSDYLTDLNQFYNAQYYYRDEAIAAPHNLFSNSELFNYALRDLSVETTPGDFTTWTFKPEPPASELPDQVAPLTIAYSSDDYAVEWRYQASSNTYLRWNGGVEHNDANTAEQLQAHNIIVQRVATTLLEPATGRLAMETLGQGEALLFQDGEVNVGRWLKNDRGQRTAFLDDTGAEWQYNPGTTWIEVVPTEISVTY